MHLVGWLSKDFDDGEISKKALEQNLKLAPVSEYFENGSNRNGLILGYTAFDENQIKAGVKKIKEILTSGKKSV